jgi:phytoene dehydrogenase-like protein
MRTPVTDIDVAVVGGGLAGLTAAAFAARAGATVRLFDARSGLGGRARTATYDGFHFNEGPHALYRASAGAAVIRELGIRPKGGRAPLLGSRFSLDGRLRSAPPRRAATQFLGLVRRLGADRRDPGLVQVSAQEWIDGRITDPVGRQFAAAAVRVSSYSGDLSTFSADAAVAQLSAALRGVTYLHDGWAQLVGALDDVARASGATIDTDAKVTAIEPDGDRLVVEAGDGRRLVARSVVLAAGGPSVAARLVGGSSAVLDAAAASAVPVRAACLDLGLRRLPEPSTRFVLGVDGATYASVHTPAARLADHGHVVHLMHYEPDDHIGLRDLEALADELQPGWRTEEAARQFGQRRVVAFDRPQPGTGLRGRLGPIVEDLPGVFVAGDWVGPSDLLGGAALASGRAAGISACRHRAPDRGSHSVEAAR